MTTEKLRRVRTVTTQYPSFVGLTYLPGALLFIALAFVNPHASGPLTFFGFWAVVLPLLILLSRRISRWYRTRFGQVVPRAHRARRSRLIMGGFLVTALGLSISAGIVPWDERRGIQITHLMWAIAFIAIWWVGDFAGDRLHLPAGAALLVVLAFLGHSGFVVGSFDLVPDTTEGPALLDGVVIGVACYLDHRWLVRRLRGLGSALTGEACGQAESSR